MYVPLVFLLYSLSNPLFLLFMMTKNLCIRLSRLRLRIKLAFEVEHVQDMFPRHGNNHHSPRNLWKKSWLYMCVCMCVKNGINNQWTREEIPCHVIIYESWEQYAKLNKSKINIAQLHLYVKSKRDYIETVKWWLPIVKYSGKWDILVRVYTHLKIRWVRSEDLRYSVVTQTIAHREQS